MHTVDGGTHETGFKTAITRVLNDYGRKYNILKAEEKLTGEDVREGLTAVISVKLEDAQFGVPDQGQAGQQRGAHARRGASSTKAGNLFGGKPQYRPRHHREAIAASRAREAASAPAS